MPIEAILGTGLTWLEAAILAYFFLVNGFYLLLLASAGIEMWRHTHSVRGEDRRRVLSSPVAPRISVLAPAYNLPSAATSQTQANSIPVPPYS